MFKIAFYALLMVGITYVVPGISVTAFWPVAVAAGVIFAVGNSLIRAIFSGNIVFGVIAFIINALLFWYLATVLAWISGQFGINLNGFSVATFTAAVFGSILASLGVYVINEVF
jgi:uncharacterized membrane protein YvlD (DUF360 family)